MSQVTAMPTLTVVKSGKVVNQVVGYHGKAKTQELFAKLERRELPARLGSAPMAPCTLLASTTSSRRPTNALPTISSDSPAE